MKYRNEMLCLEYEIYLDWRNPFQNWMVFAQDINRITEFKYYRIHGMEMNGFYCNLNLKVKVKLSLFLTKHHAMKTYWGSEGIAPRILDLGTRGRWVVSFTLRPLYSRDWIEGWVGPRAVLGAAVKRKIPRTRRESNPRTPIVQPVAQRYTDWAITAHVMWTLFIWRLEKQDN
jgi:hypothetical protein